MSKILYQLAETIAARSKSNAKESYVASLLHAPIERSARKVGEEALETVIASLSADKESMRDEAADLLFHLLILLRRVDVDFGEVEAELSRRFGRSGHEEKASRTAE